jgi:hypothetical protein
MYIHVDATCVHKSQQQQVDSDRTAAEWKFDPY